MATPCGFDNGGILVVQAEGTFNGLSKVINSYQLLLTDGGPVTYEDWRDDIRDWGDALYTLVKAVCNVLMVFEGVRGEFTQGVCSSGFIPFVTPLTGELLGDPVPSGVAALISFPTGVSRVVPRKYFGVLDAGVIDTNGNLADTTFGDFNAIGAYLRDPQTINGRTWQYGYLSPKTSSFEVPFSAVLSQTPAYQRRRRVGTGI